MPCFRPGIHVFSFEEMDPRVKPAGDA